ncbi:hypothetical protein [Escherichia phage EP_H11]|nr:hypothetical protein [Escherichia phage EP_H11]
MGKIYNPLLIHTVGDSICYEGRKFIGTDALQPVWYNGIESHVDDIDDFWTTDWYPIRNFTIAGSKAVLRRNLACEGFGGMQLYYLLATHKTYINEKYRHNLIDDISNRRYYGMGNGILRIVEELLKSFPIIITDDRFIIKELGDMVVPIEDVITCGRRDRKLYSKETVRDYINKQRIQDLSSQGRVMTLLLSNVELSSAIIYETQDKRNCACTMINYRRSRKMPPNQK